MACDPGFLLAGLIEGPSAELVGLRKALIFLREKHGAQVDTLASTWWLRTRVQHSCLEIARALAIHIDAPYDSGHLDRAAGRDQGSPQDHSD